MKYTMIVIVIMSLCACKAADIAQLESLGSRHKVTCYSGGTIIYDGESSGNVSNQDKSDGWYWKDTKTGKLVEATGPCIIVQE